MEKSVEIDAVLENHYNLGGSTTTKMEGYASTNFKVTLGGHFYVLKIYGYDAETLAQIVAENEILRLLEKQGIACSKVIATRSQKPHYITDQFIFRVLTFIEGTFLSEATHTDYLLGSFGNFLAQTDLALSQYNNAVIRAKDTQWDLNYFQKNWKYLGDIPMASDRSLVDYFCLQFQEHIIPLQFEFRTQIIHNDANDWNVLVNHEEVTGIIDFGDMCHTWLINELAVALTYVMMEKEHPLKTASEVITAYHKVLPLEKKEMDALYYLVAGRLCTSVLNSAHAKKSRPDATYITISEQSAWKLLRKWLTISPILAKNTFRGACGFAMDESKTLPVQLQRRKKNLGASLSLSYQEPIQMAGAAFQYMYDTAGNTFLDAYNNIIQVGHCHPKVVRAGQRTMSRLNTNTRYIYEELLSYTDALLSKFPSQLNKVYLVNSGSAASDLALRIAKTFTEKNMTMVMEHGYHGNTQNTIDISHYKYNHKGGKGRADSIIEAKLPKYFQSGFDSEEAAATHFSSLALTDIRKNKGQIAAFITEPIVGCGGQVPLPKTYLAPIYEAIRAQGGVCISDEVQVGFGRMGRHFWGYELYDVVPDIVILGKPIGNGHPMAAVITTTALSERFNNGMEFFSSFGGNPVSCAIGEAVLKVLEEEDLPGKAERVGGYLKDGLKHLQTTFSIMGDVRGEGLFLGVEIVDANGRPGTELAA